MCISFIFRNRDDAKLSILEFGDKSCMDIGGNPNYVSWLDATERLMFALIGGVHGTYCNRIVQVCTDILNSKVLHVYTNWTYVAYKNSWEV